jgi:ATP-dependent Clp protease, protease subunit
MAQAGNIDDDTLRRLLEKPDIRLYGMVEEEMLAHFFEQLESALQEGKDIALIELMTDGGVADFGYRIGEEIRLAKEYKGQRFLLLGKTAIYSAGMTIMSAVPRDCRYLSRNTTLLIHERRLDKQVHITGQVDASIQVAKELVAELQDGQRIQNENFAQLVEGSDISLDEICRRASTGWYMTAKEALDRRLVAGLI